jgi:hypothetical protein
VGLLIVDQRLTTSSRRVLTDADSGIIQTVFLASAHLEIGSGAAWTDAAVI